MDLARSSPLSSAEPRTSPVALPEGAAVAGEPRAAAAARAEAQTVDLVHDAYRRITRELEKVIVGQRGVVDLLLISLFAGGHSILIGVPGLAKTLLVSTLARLLSLSFKRVQFTPDLMPSDITGTDVLQEDRLTGTRSFRFLKGPIFTNMLLADEINRTPPKTQAALLEAMQERHVTVGEATYDLPSPFLVIATQNPIEQEGTYNLPEAQLDRFLFAIQVRYPSAEEELEIMKRIAPPAAIPLDKVIGAADILRIQEIVPRVPAAEHVHRFALGLARSSRPEDPGAPAYVKECLAWGAGPRAAQNLIHAAKARALLHGRFHVTTGDVEAVAVPVLAHRLVTNFHAESEGITAAALVDKLLRDVPRDRDAAP
jgi:MoxR-like ATPase